MPIRIQGGKNNNKHSWHLNPGKMVARIGKPIPYESYKDLSVEELRDFLRDTIIGLQKTATELDLQYKKRR